MAKFLVLLQVETPKHVTEVNDHAIHEALCQMIFEDCRAMMVHDQITVELIYTPHLVPEDVQQHQSCTIVVPGKLTQYAPCSMTICQPPLMVDYDMIQILFARGLDQSEQDDVNSLFTPELLDWRDDQTLWVWSSAVELNRWLQWSVELWGEEEHLS